MARLKTSVTTEGEIPLVATVPKTILQIKAPTNQIVAFKGFSVSFDGVLGTAEPVQVELMFQASPGTMSSATMQKDVPMGSETIQTTAKKNATVEPTDLSPVAVIRRYDIHPQTGHERSYAYDEEILVPGGMYLGIRCTAPANVNVTGFMAMEE